MKKQRQKTKMGFLSISYLLIVLMFAAFTACGGGDEGGGGGDDSGGDTGGGTGTDSWTATSTTNAPSARSYHTAVWTGSEMIVWGGYDVSGVYLNTGGRYNPSTDTWTATPTTNAPSARTNHTAVWTGTEMIVWGGRNSSGTNFFYTGGRYNPSTDTWTSITNQPSGRYYHTAVWTGSEMIVWGGWGEYNFSRRLWPTLSTGGRYNPSTDTWIPTSTTAPTGRTYHAAVWTGSEMIVWGGGSAFADNSLRGYTDTLATGGWYNPSTDTWALTTITNAPSARYYHAAVWTGTEMIIWGGYGYSADGSGAYLNTGGRYNPSTDTWALTTITNAPSARYYHTAVWTGSEMIVWGNNTGGTYNPSTDTWTATSTTNAPSARTNHTAVWTGTEMIVWGGGSNTGGRYMP